jgi:predicted dehydrogenase
MDVSIHDVDFARWCLGDVERVFARGLDLAEGQPHSHALILLRFKSGAIGHLEGSWAYPPGHFRTMFEIAGDQGLVEFDSLAPAPLTVTMKMNNGAMNNEQAVGVPVSESPLYPTDDPYYRELEHFLTCLEHGNEFLVSARDGLEAVKLSLAAIESMRTGRPIDLDEFEEQAR